MNTFAGKAHKTENKSVATTVSQNRNLGESAVQFMDNRETSVAQRNLQAVANNSAQVQQLMTFQAMARNSGSPAAQLKSKTSGQDGVPIQRAKAAVVSASKSKYQITASGTPDEFTGGSAAGYHGVDGVRYYSASFHASNQLNVNNKKTGKAKSEESNVMDNDLPEYANGHLLPNEFGGSGGKNNVFKQEGGQNSGSWRSFEIAASKVLNKTPSDETFTYEMTLRGDNLNEY